MAGSEPGTRRQLAANSVVLAVLLGGACAALLAVLSALFPAFAGPSTSSSRLLVYAAIPTLILKVLLKYLVGADYRVGIANASWLLPPAATLLINAGLAVAGHLSVTTVFATWVAAHTAAAALLAWYVAARGVGFGRPDLALAKRSLAFGWRSHLGRVMMVGNYRLDMWVVGAVAGPTELGLYSIAVAWSEVLTSQRRPMLASAGTAVAFVVTIVLDAVLIPIHGGLGAAIASCFAYTAGGVAMVVIFTRALGTPVKELLPRPRELLENGRRLSPALRKLRGRSAA